MSIPTAERWLPIPGFDGYEVSDLGRVMSYKSKTPRLLKLHLNTNGYIHAGIYRDAKMCFRTVHGLVALAFLGPRPDGLVIRHLDGDPTHNALSNICYGTHRENALDTVRHGRHHLASKTHCKHGHLFDADNTQINKDGHRHCRACIRDSRDARAFAAANVKLLSKVS